MTERRAAWLLAALVFLLHVPFFGLGPGLDPDAWRMVSVGRDWVAGNGYEPSRLPGYPLMEGLLGLTTSSSFLLAHALVALGAALGAAVTFRLFRRTSPRGAAVAAFAVAIQPVWFATTMELMDYGISVPLLAGALLGAAGGRSLAAGVLLGLAIGFRFNDALYLPVLLIAAPGRRLHLTIAAAVTGLLVLSPTLLQNGLAAFTTIVGHHPLPSAGDLARGVYHVVVELMTIPVLAVAGVFVMRERKRPEGRLGRAALLGAAIASLTYVRHPAEIEYLLPLFLFIPLIWPGLWRGRRAWVLLGAIVIGHVAVWAPRPDRPFRVWPGYAAQRVSEQREREAHVAELIERGREGRVVTILAPLLPIVTLDHEARGLREEDAFGGTVYRDPATGSLHTYLLDGAQLDSLRSAGYEPLASEYAVPLSQSTRGVNLYQRTTLLPATATKK